MVSKCAQRLGLTPETPTSAFAQREYVTLVLAAQGCSDLGGGTAVRVWVTACLSRLASGNHSAYSASYWWLENQYKQSLHYKMQLPLPIGDASFGGGRKYPEGCTCEVMTTTTIWWSFTWTRAAPYNPRSMAAIPEAGTGERFPVLALQRCWKHRGVTTCFLRFLQVTERKRLILTILPTVWSVLDFTEVSKHYNMSMCAEQHFLKCWIAQEFHVDC